MLSRLIFALSLALLGAFIGGGIVWLATWQVDASAMAAIALAPIFALLGLALGGRQLSRNSSPANGYMPFWRQ